MVAGKRKQALTVARLKRQAEKREEAKASRASRTNKKHGSSALLLSVAAAMLASSTIK